MKRNLFVMGVAAVAVLFFGFTPAGADVLDEIMAAGVIKVSTDPNYAPQSSLNEKGELEGFDIDTAREVAKRLGVEVEFVTPEWDMITSGNWGKRWDLSIGSMTPTKERSQALFFTAPYYYTPAQFVVHTSNTTVKKRSDLAGKRIGVCSECTYDRYLNNDLEIFGAEIVYLDWEAKVRTYATDADAIQDLSLGDGVRLDAVLSATYTLVEAMRNGCSGGCPLKFVGDPVYYEPLSFAADRSRPDSERFINRLDDILAGMHADGTMTELSMKWYGVDLTSKK